MREERQAIARRARANSYRNHSHTRAAAFSASSNYVGRKEGGCDWRASLELFLGTAPNNVAPEVGWADRRISLAFCPTKGAKTTYQAHGQQHRSRIG